MGHSTDHAIAPSASETATSWLSRNATYALSASYAGEKLAGAGNVATHFRCNGNVSPAAVAGWPVGTARRIATQTLDMVVRWKRTPL